MKTAVRPDPHVSSVREAEGCGYNIHRQSIALGHSCTVVATP